MTTTAIVKPRASHSWFEADPKGLSKQFASRPVRAVYELIQNALDENVTNVEVWLRRTNDAFIELTVRDDSPEGFHDLSHTYRMFAESKKKAVSTARGQFNFGEKVAISLCRQSYIRSTTGTVYFESNGQRTVSTEKTEAGSLFWGSMRMSESEFTEVMLGLSLVIVPPHVNLTVNGTRSLSRASVLSFEGKLPSPMPDSEGVMRTKQREAKVQAYAPVGDEEPMLYEMGIPVVATDFPFHLDVGQKIPLTLDRENVVGAGFMRALRSAVLEASNYLLSEEQAAAPWVTEALATASSGVVSAIIERRFGANVVKFDLSDMEANDRAKAAGYTLLYGGTFPKAVWARIKEFETVRSSGELFPTPGRNLDGPPAKLVPLERWTPGMHYVVDLTQALARRLVDCDLMVQVIDERQARFKADYVRSNDPIMGALMPPVIRFNVAWLGWDWFNTSRKHLGRTVDLIVHEISHHIESNHLSDEYHHALSAFAGRIAEIALAESSIFDSPKPGGTYA